MQVKWPTRTTIRSRSRLTCTHSIFAAPAFPSGRIIRTSARTKAVTRHDRDQYTRALYKADVRGAILDVLGHESAARGLDRDGRSNAYGEELEALVAALDE
jgi:hypothetical protein